MPQRNIAIFCSGYGSNFQAIVEAVGKKKLKVSIALMVCDNPKAHAIQRAKASNIPVVLIPPELFKSRKDYEKVIVRILKNQKIDWIVLAGFMRIFTFYFINTYKGKILNIHPSLLPDFKGAHAIKDAFEAGVKQTGVTVHLVTKEVDAGPILIQKKIPVSKKDTLKTLEAKIHRVEHRLYPLAIQQVIAR